MRRKPRCSGDEATRAHVLRIYSSRRWWSARRLEGTHLMIIKGGKRFLCRHLARGDRVY